MMKKLLWLSIFANLCWSSPGLTANAHKSLLQRVNRAATNHSKVSFVSRFQLNPSFVVEKYKLSHGLSILILEDYTAPVFAYQTWFRVGSRDEKKGKIGIAHLFEHMLFNATKHLSAKHLKLVLVGSWSKLGPILKQIPHIHQLLRASYKDLQKLHE